MQHGRNSEGTDVETSNKEENPIPLPPRDRNKVLLAIKPRHTRKHPLILPASTSLQRTLEKVTIPSPPPLSQPPEPTYANDTANNNHYISGGDFDTESLHFEAQIESSLDALDEIPQEQDCIDGAFDKRSSTNSDEIDIKPQSHHVSCEDLLKFANTKPSSRARGNDSDEVRIMSKVLGKDVSRLFYFPTAIDSHLLRIAFF